MVLLLIRLYMLWVCPHRPGFFWKSSVFQRHMMFCRWHTKERQAYRDVARHWRQYWHGWSLSTLRQPEHPTVQRLWIEPLIAFGKQAGHVWKVCRRGSGIEHAPWWIGLKARPDELRLRILSAATAMQALLVAVVIWSMLHEAEVPILAVGLVRAAAADGNLTAAGTWQTVDNTATTGVSYLQAEATVATVQQSYLPSSVFSWSSGAPTIDGIGIRLGQRIGTTGTFSVHLEVATVEVAGTLVTINMTDWPAVASADTDGGWAFFKFAAPVALANATSYSVAVRTSSASQASIWRDATTSNWSRFLRTTTTGAPAAGDDLVITKELTGAGTSTARTVTMDQTAATDYGAASTSLVTPAISIGDGGSLVFGAAAATAYQLKVSGNAITYRGGTLAMGAVGAEMPRDSTALLLFDCGANVDFGETVRNGGMSIKQGLSRTSGKNVVQCLLEYKSTVTITNAAPGVVSWTAHRFANNNLVMLTTAGTLPSPLVHNQAYFVRNVAANTFELALTSGGASITTATAGSGVHTAHGQITAGATSFGVSADSGWLDNDVIGMSSTTRTFSEFESGTLNGNAGASSLTVDGFLGAGGGVASAHAGHAPIQAEIVLLTRSVVVRGVSASLQSYVNVASGASFDWDWTEFKWHGSATAGKRGVDFLAGTTVGPMTIDYCSFHSFAVTSSIGLNFLSSSWSAQVSNTVLYNIQATAVNCASTTSNAWSFNLCTVVGGNAACFIMSDLCGTFTNCRAVSNASGFDFRESTQNETFSPTISDLVSHSCSGAGWSSNSILRRNANPITTTRLTIWRCNAAGFQNGSSLTGFVFDDLTIFGCNGAQVTMTATPFEAVFNRPRLNADPVFGAAGFRVGSGGRTYVFDGSIGVVDGFYRATTTYDVTLEGTGQLVMHNTTAAGPGVIVDNGVNGVASYKGYVSSQRHNGVAGDHRMYKREGTLATEATIVHANSRSLSMTPGARALTSATRLESESFTAGVLSGRTLKPSVMVRKTSAYDGVAPRLMLRANQAAGISADTVIATMAGGANQWEQLTGTTIAVTDDAVLEFYVDCTFGTGGTVYVASAGAYGAVVGGQMQCWLNGAPMAGLPPSLGPMNMEGL